MRDKYEVSKPLKASFKIDGTRYPSCQVKIKPKGKYLEYYAVVTAGHRNGIPFKYSLATAEPYALENTLKRHQRDITLGAIEELQKEAENVDRE